MHRSIDGHSPYYMFLLILTIDYTKNFTTMSLLTIDYMAMFVVKYAHVQIISQVMDLSINDWRYFVSATAKDETKFVEEAVHKLLKARRVLKFSYVYGYYLDGPPYRKIVFEFMQVGFVLEVLKSSYFVSKVPGILFNSPSIEIHSFSIKVTCFVFCLNFSWNYPKYWNYSKLRL